MSQAVIQVENLHKSFGDLDVLKGINLDVGKGDVADDRVDAALGQARVAEVLDTDFLARMPRAGDAAGEAVELDADEMHVLRRLAQEASIAAARLEHGGMVGHAKTRQSAVHGLDHHGRGIERRKGRAFGAVIFLRR